jgi:hypothetical protein
MVVISAVLKPGSLNRSAHYLVAIGFAAAGWLYFIVWVALLLI